MRFAFKTLTLLLITLCTTAAFAAADHWRVDIPFDFSAQGQSFPAGAYDVTINLDYNVIVMTNNDGIRTQITSSVIPTEAPLMPVIVRFDKVGTGHVLKNIQVEQWITPKLDSGIKQDISAPGSTIDQ